MTDKKIHWSTQGRCKVEEIATKVFFPEQGGDSVTPKEICRTCLVKTECLEYALDNFIQFGIWGGTSENQRRRMRRDRGVAPPEFYDPARDIWVLADNRSYTSTAY